MKRHRSIEIKPSTFFDQNIKLRTRLLSEVVLETRILKMEREGSVGPSDQSKKIPF